MTAVQLAGVRGRGICGGMRKWAKVVAVAIGTLYFLVAMIHFQLHVGNEPEGSPAEGRFYPAMRAFIWPYWLVTERGFAP